MTLRAGDTFAGYTILRPIGAGGMGEVYLARHPRLPKNVALKLLGSAISTDRAFCERFLREADLAARLWHPHIVAVQDRGEDGGRLWIAMDYVDGCDAAQLLADKYPAGMPGELAIPIVTAVASALDHAHEQGLLHRDVKPANIMLSHFDDSGQRRILLTDFGIAREMEDASGLTQTNMTVGTVAYSAPEQLMAEDIDGRADQYSLAATAYQLLTGVTLFPATNPAAVIGHHLSSPPPKLVRARPDLAPLDEVFAIALAKNPDNRFSRCDDFARALAEQSAGSSSAFSAFSDTAQAHAVPSPGAIPTRPKERQGSRTRVVVLGSVGVLGALVLGVLFTAWSRNDESTPARPTASASAPTVDLAPPSTVTVSVLPPLTVTKTAIPTAAPPQSVESPTPPFSGWPVVIVGTCDEGGSCGVQQRTQPYNSAPRLYPNALRDGTSVAVVCATTGDLRTSRGRGASRIWYMLNNGAFINSVYATSPRTEIPTC